ncbi:hypothetical protein OS493_026248 [Desmophyllum pertusum]|uniref:Uncharacterized protein n=1 Tax=Desmophyllum pertusum TaxID=174260 RepID=A0A9W9ZL46_9CNID|nr:hypothetical protein OS493_026248 [Desmophyllum pertusum]
MRYTILQKHFIMSKKHKNGALKLTLDKLSRRDSPSENLHGKPPSARVRGDKTPQSVMGWVTIPPLHHRAVDQRKSIQSGGRSMLTMVLVVLDSETPVAWERTQTDFRLLLHAAVKIQRRLIVIKVENLTILK